MKKIILMTIVLLISVPLTFRAEETEELPDLETKVALEIGLEKRLKTILEEIIGTDKISVSVNVHLYTRRDRITLNREQPKKKKKQGMVLPGVPVRESLGDSQEPILAPLTYEENRTMIKRITANIFLDTKISDELLKMVDRMARALLGIDPDRGDKLVIERIPFGQWYFDWKDMLQPPDVYVVAALSIGLMIMLFGCIFLFGPFRSFFVHLVGSIEAIAEKLQTAGSSSEGGGAQSIDIALQQTALPVSGQQDSKGERKPFAFLNESYLNELIFLCKKETPEAVAILSSYLRPVLASKLIGSLDAAVQTKVVQELSQIKEKPPELVKGFERMLKEKIDYLIGGEERLQQIINFSDTDLQKRMMESVQSTNPAFAARMKKMMFAFEDIVKLDINTLQMLIRNINPAIFSQVLKSSSEEFRKKLFLALPPGLAERIEQEMDMGKPLTAKRIEDEKRVVVQLVKNYEQQGLIDLGNLGKS